MPSPAILKSVVVLIFTASLAACSGPEGRSRSPVGPSSVTPIVSSQAITAIDDVTRDVAPTDRGPAIELPGGDRSGTNAVTFPPRQEPVLFRTALEAKYRDSLRRSSVLTYVDQEGTVVWTQEYLRYRLNLCSHVDAITRVFQQISGFGVQPVCGSTNAVNFPPRNEPFDFMVQLEALYRDGLRRTAGPSFVDMEGNIVWTQEYLRYRVTGCGHTEAQQKVFDQIDGRGVAATCGGGSSNSFTGTIGSLGDTSFLITMNFTGLYQATLSWADASIDLDLYLATTSCTTYPPTACLRAVSNGVGRNTESISFSVRAGEQYRLWVDNFTARATSFTVTHVIATGSTTNPVTVVEPASASVQGVGGRAKVKLDR